MKFYKTDDFKFNYKVRNVILDKKPEFRSKKYPKSTDYWVVLNFKGDSLEYRISGTEYEFLKSNSFKNSIEENDSVKIVEYENQILAIYKNNINYINIKKAENYRKDGGLVMMIIMSIALILCIIPIVINKKHELSFSILNIKLKYNYLFIVLAIYAFIALPNVKNY